MHYPTQTVQMVSNILASKPLASFPYLYMGSATTLSRVLAMVKAMCFCVLFVVGLIPVDIALLLPLWV